jgi:phosphatidylinositol alpha-1,6-mannosyltransferase
MSAAGSDGGTASDGAAGGGPQAPAGGRLLAITPDFPPAFGGIQVHVHRIVSGLRGYQVEVVTAAQPDAAAFDAGSRIATHRARAVGPPPARAAAVDLLALRRAVAFRPELVLSCHIVTSPAAALIRRALGARTVQLFYAKEIAGRPRLAGFAARRADVTVAISSYSAALVAEVGGSPDRLSLISPGVDIPAVTTPIDAGRPTVVTVARLEDRYKGHDVLIEALSIVRERVPDVQWVVIGEGSLRGELEAMARDRGVAGVARFLGGVDLEERNRWLRSADVFAMPSRLPGEGRAGEGFGIVYLEAGTYGKPVVAGNVAGAVDAVVDGETGLLVDPASPTEVAAAITRLLLEPQLARRMGAAGAAHASGFAWPLIAERVQRVLDAQLSQLRSRR